MEINENILQYGKKITIAAYSKYHAKLFSAQDLLHDIIFAIWLRLQFDCIGGVFSILLRLQNCCKKAAGVYTQYPLNKKIDRFLKTIDRFFPNLIFI